MNLASIGFKSFYKYYVDEVGIKHKSKASETPTSNWKEITKDEYESTRESVSSVDFNSGGTAVTIIDRRDQLVESGEDAQRDSASSLPDVAAPSGVPQSATDSYGPANFQDVLRRLDSLIGETTGISQLQMDEARQYVVEIMTTLKVYPEFEGILVDKDVHNVMVFVQSSTQLATADFIVKKEKKATLAAKKEKAVGTMKFDMIAFDGPIGKPESGMDFAAAFGSVDAFASLNVDAIAAKDRRDGKK